MSVVCGALDNDLMHLCSQRHREKKYMIKNSIIHIYLYPCEHLYK